MFIALLVMCVVTASWPMLISLHTQNAKTQNLLTTFIFDVRVLFVGSSSSAVAQANNEGNVLGGNGWLARAAARTADWFKKAFGFGVKLNMQEDIARSNAPLVLKDATRIVDDDRCTFFLDVWMFTAGLTSQIVCARCA